MLLFQAAIQSTRRTSEVLSYANIYADMLILLLKGTSVKSLPSLLITHSLFVLH